MGYCWKKYDQLTIGEIRWYFEFQCSSSIYLQFTFHSLQIVLHIFYSGFILAVSGREKVKHTDSISHETGAQHIYMYIPYECITYLKIDHLKNTLYTICVCCYTNRHCEHWKKLVSSISLFWAKSFKGHTQPYCPEIVSSSFHWLKAVQPLDYG